MPRAKAIKDGIGHPFHDRNNPKSGNQQTTFEEEQGENLIAFGGIDFRELEQKLKPISYLHVIARTQNDSVLQNDNAIRQAIKDLYPVLKDSLNDFQAIVIRSETTPVEVLEWILKTYSECADIGTNWNIIRRKTGFGLEFFNNYEDIDLYRGYGFEACYFPILEKKDPLLFKAIFNLLSLLFHKKHITTWDNDDDMAYAIETAEECIENEGLDDDDKAEALKFVAEYKEGGIAAEFGEAIRKNEVTLEQYIASVDRLNNKKELHQMFLPALKIGIDFIKDPHTLGDFVLWESEDIDRSLENTGDYPIFPQELFPVLWRADDADPVWGQYNWMFQAKQENGAEAIPLQHNFKIDKHTRELPVFPTFPYLQVDFFDTINAAVQNLIDYYQKHWSPLLLHKL